VIVNRLGNSFFFLLEARLQSNIGLILLRAFGGVHAFGYNSTEDEPIWMKSGAL